MSGFFGVVRNGSTPVRFDPRSVRRTPWHRRVSMFLRKLRISIAVDWHETKYEYVSERKA